jgi:hypothetical protein
MGNKRNTKALGGPRQAYAPVVNVPVVRVPNYYIYNIKQINYLNY